DDIATIEKPPNHELFCDIPTRGWSAGSPLLERRLQNMKNTQNSAAAMPVIHVHIPGGNGSQIPPSIPSVSSDLPSSSSMLPSMGKLLKYPKMGPDLNVEQFCSLYDLGTEILKRLKENGYQKTKTFKHITIVQLHEMSFKHREIASLQDAVDEWANSD
ncbi:hypothetical protein BYT27DRAFT_7120481, partial [Phlegmacium glaucopus]